jgi:hypothetical protein
MGMLVGYTQEYSDLLLITLLKAHLPEKYRERVEQSGTAGSASAASGTARTARARRTTAGRVIGHLPMARMLRWEGPGRQRPPDD